MFYLLMLSASIITIFISHEAYASQLNELSPCALNNIKLKVYPNGSSRSKKRLHPISKIRYDPFDIFTHELFEHASTKLMNEAECQQGTPEPVEILLVFVEKTITPQRSEPKGESQLAELESLSMHDLSCQLSSPWLKMSIQRNPTLKVSAIFIWDQRQFLIDQALLVYPSLANTFKPKALTNELFYRYANIYEDSYNLLPPFRKRPTPETVPNIPVDLLWLFGFGFGGEITMIYDLVERISSSGATGYTKIIKSLFNQCVASNKYELQQYKTIFDLGNVEGTIALNDYQIKKLKSKYK